MCGIYGVLGPDSAVVSESGILGRMGDVTYHRGPDDFGELVRPGVAMGMRRLAIIDVDGGRQPLGNEDETIWVVANGEIYNFRELRNELESRGHRFRTNSDCEVIVHLYEEYGDDCVTRLKGMFGFCLWDTRNRTALIGRDRLGIKPLYYAPLGRELVFASEAKAILEHPGVSPQLNAIAVEEYLTLGYTPGPESFFDGILKVPPGHVLKVHEGCHELKRYWTIAPDIDESVSERDWCNQLLETLTTSVESQMVSDVPLGAFLSGGIDSSAVVAMMTKASEQPVKTYSIGFSGSTGSALYNELPFARQVANQFNTDHHEIVVQPDVVSLLPQLLWHMDEPIADAAFITTYLVAKFARQDVTVILSGVGGDELFGGYRRYLGEYYHRLYRRLPAVLRSRVLTPLAKLLPSDRHSALLNYSRLAKMFVLTANLDDQQRYCAYVQTLDASQREELLVREADRADDALTRAFGAASKADYLRTLMDVDLATQLPEDLLMLTDKMTMATSLECRVPLLDESMVDLAARMPAAMKIRGRTLKYALKRALSGTLDDDILHRQKRGFGAPVGAWLKSELAGLMDHLVNKEVVARRGILRWEPIERAIGEHRGSRGDYTDHLVALINLELWCRLFLDRQSVEDLTAELVDVCR